MLDVRQFSGQDLAECFQNAEAVFTYIEFFLNAWIGDADHFRFVGNLRADRDFRAARPEAGDLLRRLVHGRGIDKADEIFINNGRTGNDAELSGFTCQVYIARDLDGDIIKSIGL